MSRSSTRAALVAADAVLSFENTPYWNTDAAALSSAGFPADASSTDPAKGHWTFRNDAGTAILIIQRRLTDSDPQVSDEAATQHAVDVSGPQQLAELDIKTGHAAPARLAAIRSKHGSTHRSEVRAVALSDPIHARRLYGVESGCPEDGPGLLRCETQQAAQRIQVGGVLLAEPPAKLVVEHLGPAERRNGLHRHTMMPAAKCPEDASEMSGLGSAREA